MVKSVKYGPWFQPMSEEEMVYFTHMIQNDDEILRIIQELELCIKKMFNAKEVGITATYEADYLVAITFDTGNTYKFKIDSVASLASIDPPTERTIKNIVVMDAL